MFGNLETMPARGRKDLLAVPVVDALETWSRGDGVLVAPIDPDLADTAAFCAAYAVGLDISANCVIIAGKRDGETRFAACVVLATTRTDVNGVVRRTLDVRKASFAPMDVAVAETGMEYGGITAIGLPAPDARRASVAVSRESSDVAPWPILVDSRVVATSYVIMGSGVRHSKIVLPGAAVAELPGAVVVEGLAIEIPR
jgi:prolyl-tRNA editing enzyme YbaK/EbsC (Cys-tRNA(Pro) deacylase)